MSPTLPARTTVLDDVLPASRYRTTHARPVRVSVDATADAIRTTPLRDAPLARALLLVRGVGSVLDHGDLTVADIARLEEPGIVELVAGPHEVAFGWVGQPWPRASGFATPLPTTQQGFVAFDDADAVRVALSIRCDGAAYGTLLVTETRIEPGLNAGRAFGRYWSVVRFGSGLVRRSLLRAIAEHAEAGAADAGA